MLIVEGSFPDLVVLMYSHDQMQRTLAIITTGVYHFLMFCYFISSH